MAFEGDLEPEKCYKEISCDVYIYFIESSKNSEMHDKAVRIFSNLYWGEYNNSTTVFSEQLFKRFNMELLVDRAVQS